MANEHKPEPVSSSALIPAAEKSFANMKSVADLQTLQASAPAFHSIVSDALVRSGRVRDDGSHTDVQRVHAKPPEVKKSGFRTGAPAIHITTGKKVTIIHANAGHTKKTRTPVHRVADRNGDTWLEKETNLKLRM